MKTNPELTAIANTITTSLQTEELSAAEITAVMAIANTLLGLPESRRWEFMSATTAGISNHTATGTKITNDVGA